MTRQRRRRLAQKGITVKTLELRPEGPEYTIPTLEGTTVTRKEQPWSELVCNVANAPPVGPNGQPGGFDPQLMRKRLKIIKAVDHLSNGDLALELEDADATELAAALTGVRWMRMSQWIVDFCDAVEALPKQKDE